MTSRVRSGCRIVQCAFAGNVFAVLIALATPAYAGGVVYVDDSATDANEGTAWCDAFIHLQDALAAAGTSGGSISEIRVAQGLYKPDVGAGQTGGARGSTFQLLSGVAIRGGYAGCGAPNPNARVIDGYSTILTGDLAGNDIGDRFSASSHAENAYHVVTGSGTNATAILDGVTVTAGRANGAFPDNSGGGMYTDGGSPTILDCTFNQNYATYYGGAIYNRNSSGPSFTDCDLVDNSGDYGGGVNCDSDSHATMTDCLIARNTVGNHGGGVCIVDGARATLTGCTVTDNQSYYNGGGIALDNANESAMTDCAIARNKSTNGGAGGVNVGTGSELRATSCVIQDNQSSFGGGGMSVEGSARLTHCAFIENRSNFGGGLIHISGRVSPENVLFVGNSASVDGGAVYKLAPTGELVLHNGTIVGNTAGRYGGGVYSVADLFVIGDSILWGNSDEGGRDFTAQVDGSPLVSLGTSCVQGWSSQPDPASNIDADPRFVPGPAGCYYLSHKAAGQLNDSPCVDAGFGDTASSSVIGMTTRTDEAPDADVVDTGFHFPVTGQVCLMSSLQCYGKVTLREFVGFQNCFDAGGAPAELPCCSVQELDGGTGITAGDFVIFQSALTDP